MLHDLTAMKSMWTCTSCIEKLMAMHWRLQEAFLYRRHPNSRTFARIHQRLRKHGSFVPGERAGRPKRVTTRFEETVL